VWYRESICPLRVKGFNLEHCSSDTGERERFYLWVLAMILAFLIQDGDRKKDYCMQL
jgi:hypothetical protein